MFSSDRRHRSARTICPLSENAHSDGTDDDPMIISTSRANRLSVGKCADCCFHQVTAHLCTTCLPWQSAHRSRRSHCSQHPAQCPVGIDPVHCHDEVSAFIILEEQPSNVRATLPGICATHRLNSTRACRYASCTARTSDWRLGST